MTVRDSDIRAALRQKIITERAGQEETLVRPEMALLRGSTRVDVAVINHSIHGYEYKNGGDEHMNELYGQVPAFSCVLDKVTILAAGEHLPAIVGEVPSWFEIQEVVMGDKGQIDFRVIRLGDVNRDLDPYAVAQLLWRDEAYKLLLDLGVTGLRSSASCPVLWNELVDRLSLDELRETVRKQLRARRDWHQSFEPRAAGRSRKPSRGLLL
jgi:hypothetical protein